MNILSLQSMVTFGHVGHSAAQFPLQTLGHTYWPIPTTFLSNHKGYGQWAGITPNQQTMLDMANSLRTSGHLKSVDALLIGYTGTNDAVHAAAEIIRLVQADAPDALIVLDPVMGDHHAGLYVQDSVADGICQTLLPLAHICTPNTFELEYITQTKANIEAAHDLPCDLVLVTGVTEPNCAPQNVGMAAVTPKSTHWVETPLYRLSHPPSGSGDLAAALFTGHMLETEAPDIALKRTAFVMDQVFAATHKAQSRELFITQNARHITDRKEWPLSKTSP